MIHGVSDTVEHRSGFSPEGIRKAEAKMAKK